MSEPKRYAIRGFSAALVEEENGVFVRYEDYARLKAEVERLELEVFAFDRTIKQASCHYDNRLEDIRQLQAQVERLTKENETRQRDMNLMFQEIKEGREAYQRLHYLYLTAKEGKQP